jgi:hypothetical protein
MSFCFINFFLHSWFDKQNANENERMWKKNHIMKLFIIFEVSVIIH